MPFDIRGSERVSILWCGRLACTVQPRRPHHKTMSEGCLRWAKFNARIGARVRRLQESVMNRVLAIALVTAAVAPETGRAQDVQKPDKPNVVVILCDDLGYGDLGCYGHPIDPDAEPRRSRGRACASRSATAGAPVCSPSRAGLMTGRMPVAAPASTPGSPRTTRCTCRRARSRSPRCCAGPATHRPRRQVAPQRHVQLARSSRSRATTASTTGSARRTTPGRRTRTRRTSCATARPSARRRASRASSSPTRRSTG